MALQMALQMAFLQMAARAARRVRAIADTRCLWLQAASPDTRDQLAGLSGPVRDCILKAARLCESSRANGSVQRANPDVPIDSMLQLIMSLDPPSALSCLTQLYGQNLSSSQPQNAPLDYDAASMSALQARLPAGAGLPQGSGAATLAGLAGLSSGVSGSAGLLAGGLGDSTGPFLPATSAALARDVPNQGARSSISQMSSQLRALVDDQPPPQLPTGAGAGAPASAGAGVSPFRPVTSAEEQLASLLGASHSQPSAPSTLSGLGLGMPPGGAVLGAAGDLSNSLRGPLTGAGDMNSSLLGQLHSKDALSALLAGSSHGDMPSNVPNILTAGAQRQSESGLWSTGPLSSPLLDEPRSTAL